MADIENKIRRLQYHDGQLLDVSDFRDEQDYHREMRMRHNRLVHSWGIAEGLKVTIANKKITVAPGMALDKDGQELCLLAEAPLDLPDLKSTTRYVTAKFEEPDDKSTEVKDTDTGKIYSRRTIERANIEVTPPDTKPAGDGSVIVLAKLDWNDEGKVEDDPSARSRSVGSRIDPAADLVVGRLSLARTNDTRGALFLAGLGDFNHVLYNNRSNIDGEGIWDGAKWNPGQLDIRAGTFAGRKSALFIDSDGNVGIGTTEPKGFQIVLPEKGEMAPGTGVTISGGKTGNASIELRNNGSGTPYIDFAQDATTTDYHARIRLTDKDKLAIERANVGIGTTDPKSTLSVKGGLAVGTAYAGTNAAPDNVLLVEGKVGIGTTSPQGRLHVSNPAQTGTGTIKSSGTKVTGSGSSFRAQLREGDLITANGQTKMISAINGDGELTVYGAFSPDITTATAFTFSPPSLVVKEGNVGIGATDPTTDLQFRNVVKDSKVEISRKAAIAHDPGNVPSELSLGIYDGAGLSGVRIVNDKSTTVSPPPGAKGANDQYICFYTHAAWVGNGYGERMRIAPNGFVGIGTATPKAPLHVEGKAVALAWEQLSDARIKLNPTPVDPVCSLKTLMNLTLCEYEYIPEYQPSSSGEKYHGFLAQEVERVIPEAVSIVGDKRLGEGRVIEGLRVVAHDRIFSEAVGAIQALHAMLQQQNARILALEGQNSAG